MADKTLEYYQRMGSEGGKASIASPNHKMPTREKKSLGGKISTRRRREQKLNLLTHDLELNRNSNKLEDEKDKTERKLLKALKELRLKMED